MVNERIVSSKPYLPYLSALLFLLAGVAIGLSSIFLDFLSLMGVVSLLLVVIGSIHFPKFILALGLFSLPIIFQREILGIDFVAFDIVAIPLIAMTLIRQVFLRKIHFTGFDIFIALYLLFLTVALLHSQILTTGLGYYRKEIIAIGYAYVIVNLLQNSRDVKRFLIIYLITGVIVSCIGIFQHFLGENGLSIFPPSPELDLPIHRGYLNYIIKGELGWVYSAYAPFKHFNTLGSYLDFLFPLALSFLIFEPARRFWWGVATLTIGFCIIVTYGRGSLICLFSSLLLFLFFSGYPTQKKFLRIVIPVVALALACGMYFWFFHSGYSESMRLTGRKDQWAFVLSLFKHDPLAGIGLTNLSHRLVAQGFNDSVHSNFINILVERGLIGLSFFLLLVASLYYQARKLLLRTTSQCHRQYVIYVICALTAFMIHSLVDHTFLIYTIIAQFFILLGILAAVTHLGTAEKL